MFITSIFIVLVLLALSQPNTQRLYAASVFISITIGHDALLSKLDGLAYYGTAASLDLLIILITAGIDPVSKMVIRLQRVCIVSVLINLMGYAAWYLYMPPTVYNIAYCMLYLWTLIIFIDRDPVENDRIFKLDRWSRCFRYDSYTFVEIARRHGFKI